MTLSCIVLPLQLGASSRILLLLFCILLRRNPRNSSNMRFLTSLLGVASIASAPVLAEILVFGVPAVIKPGQPFNASFQNALQQPSQSTIVWGYTPYDSTTPPAYMPQHNTVGMPIATVNFGGETTLIVCPRSFTIRWASPDAVHYY